MSKKIRKIGLVDADLLCNGTRHPNLAVLKIAGYFRGDIVMMKTLTNSLQTIKILKNCRGMTTSTFRAFLHIQSLTHQLFSPHF